MTGRPAIALGRPIFRDDCPLGELMVIMMTTNRKPTREALGSMIITDVLERWPKTADVFHTHAMACVGCAVAPLYTITDAAMVYGLLPERFTEEMLVVIEATTAASMDE